MSLFFIIIFLFSFIKLTQCESFISQYFQNISYSEFIKDFNLTKKYHDVIINNKNFKILPNFIFSMVYCSNLDLSKNQIEIYELNTFTKLKNLQSLNLKYNKINFIENFLMADLTELRSLNLGFNRIEVLRGKFSKNYNNLENLDLASNLLQFINAKAFEQLISIKSINLSNNKLTIIPCEIFQPMTQLTFLNIGFNKIENICSDAFKGLKNLKKLYLTNNNIKLFSKNLFSDLINIESISFGYNQARSIDDNILQNSKIIRDLIASSSQISSFKIIQYMEKINCLILEKTRITSINKNDLIHLSNLFKLSLQSSRINFIQEGSFKFLNRLTSLNLNNNKILNISKFTFEGLISLEKLSIGQNILKFIDPEAFIWFNNILTELNLSSNLLSIICKNLFHGMSNLEILDLSKNEIQSIEKDSFSNLSSLKKLLIQENNLKILTRFDIPQLVYLDLSDNYLDTVPLNTFSKCHKLKELFLSKNRLENFTYASLGNLSLNYLDLNKNFILDPTTLRANKIEIKSNKLEFINNSLFFNVEILDLSYNKIKFILNDSNNDLYMINKIYLQFNKLKKIEFLTKNFKNLNTLDLHGNLIEELKIDNFYHVTQLHHLNVSNNPIFYIEPSFFKQFKKIQSISVANIYVSNEQIEDIIFLHHIKEVNFGYLNNLEFNSSQFNKKSLKKIILNNLNINFILDLDFRYLPLLEHLDVSFTRNRILNNNNFYDLVMFRSLEISGCEIISKNLTLLNKLKLIKHLNLSFNRIEYLNKSMFEGMQSLGVLDLRNNQIKSIEEDTFYNFAFFTLSLENNFIQTLQDLKVIQLRTLKLRNNEIKIINKIDEPFFRCIELDMAFNQIENVSLHEMIDNYNKLNLLDLSNNRIMRLENSFVSHLFELKTLLLQNNHISYIEENAFETLSVLENLDLSNNSIKNLPNEIFQELISLKNLNLSQNNLEFIRENLFKNLFNLLNVDLGTNNLKMIENLSFKNLILLQSLNLENNQNLILKPNSLYGLNSIKLIYFSYTIVKEFSQMIINSIKIHQEKIVNGVIYYKSLNIHFSDHQIDCELILNFIKFNIHLNLRLLHEIEEFIENCKKKLILKI